MKPPAPTNPLLAALQAQSPRLTDYPKLALVGSAEQPLLAANDLTLGSVTELLSIVNELRLGSRCTQALMNLYAGPLKPSELAALLHLSTAAVTGLVTRLRMLGMATSERVQSERGDRREVCVTLTTAGSRVVSYIITMIKLHNAAESIKATREVSKL